MANPTIDLMMSLIRAQIVGDLSVITDKKPTEKTLADIYRLSNMHDISHMVGASLEKAKIPMSEELKAAYTKTFQRAIFRYANQTNVYEEICKLFETEKIPYLPLKGSVIRDLYPSPEFRAACDIDILVHEEDLERAQSLLVEKLGFEWDGKCYHNASLFLGSVHFELHYNITECDPRLDPMLLRVWEFASPCENSYRYKMTDEFFAFHIVAHTCHHFLRGGCGIKPFMDLWILRNKTDFNEQGVVELCRECGIETFFFAICALSDVWFSGKKHTEDTEMLEKYILMGGTYGVSANRIVVGKNKKGGKIRYLINRIFIPREGLQRLFPILKKYPILLPLCHVNRWVRVIKHGRGKIALNEIAYTVSIPKDKDAEIKEMLDKLKL